MHYFTQLLVKVLLTIRPRKISGTCQNLPIFQPQINKCFFQGFFLKAKSLLWSKKSLHKKDKLAADCRGLCWLLIIVCPLFDRCCQCHPTKGCSGSADCQTMWQCCSWSDGTVISICHNNNNLRRIINSIYAVFFLYLNLKLTSEVSSIQRQCWAAAISESPNFLMVKMISQDIFGTLSWQFKTFVLIMATHLLPDYDS